MKAKRILTSALLLFAVGSVGYLILDERGRTGVEDPVDLMSAGATVETPSVGDAAPSDTGPDRKLIAFYLHGEVRCPTCLAIEEYSQEALKASFSAELTSGTLEWRSINTDEVWNSHYWKDFDLSFSSLVIADVSGTETVRWKNLEKVWELVRDKGAFFDYIRSETQPFLEAL